MREIKKPNSVYKTIRKGIEKDLSKRRCSSGRNDRSIPQIEIVRRISMISTFPTTQFSFFSRRQFNEIIFTAGIKGQDYTTLPKLISYIITHMLTLLFVPSLDNDTILMGSY